MNLAKYLNPRQKQAADSLTGPVLVLAAAGSGKTRTLTYRTANLINQGVNPENILTVTFTNKAARDMKEKITGVIGKQKIKGMWLGTFHSICLRIIRENFNKVNRSNGCLIYDTNDSIDIIEDIVREFELDDQEYEPRIVFNVIQKAKMALNNPDDLIDNYAKESPGSQQFYRNTQHIYQEYERVLRNNNSFDFNDLIKRTIELFDSYPDILKKYQTIFKYIQVDEYQDVNHSQYYLIKNLTQPEKNIFVVGDDWQGIYSFRGADISNILEFEKDYPGARVVKLEQNYRSSQNIINASNSLIKNNSQNKHKTAWTDKKGGAPIFLAEAKNAHVEAGYVARRINELVNHYHYSYDDIAVLCRTNFQSFYIQQVFPRVNIPYQLIGGTGFYDRQEIKHFINYLRLLVNPDDALALKRMFKVEAEGIGEILLSEMNNYAHQHNLDITEVFENPTVVRGIGKKKGDNVIEFKLRVIDSIIELRQTTMSKYEKVIELYKKIEFSRNVLANLDNPEEREKYINLFIEDIYNYHKYNPEKTLYDYLLVNKLVGDQDQVDEGEEETVKVMTAHSAKGLEFSVVFIIAAEEDVFPHQKSLEEQSSQANQFAVEEERRLFYVAMTRAEKILFISYSRSRAVKINGQTHNKELQPSRFLFELPEDNLDCVKVKELRNKQLRIEKNAAILKD